MNDEIHAAALEAMGRAFRAFEKSVPPPRKVPFRNDFAFRYVEKTIAQALVLKLVRVISGLRAARLLVLKGYVQEQALLNRTIDELNEDIMFLVAAITNDTVTPLHTQFLEAFWKEALPAEGEIVGNVQKPDMPPRQKIHAYLVRVLGEGTEPTQAVGAMKAISTIYSGYVHGASVNILDLCTGSPPRFHLDGMKGTPREVEHRNDEWNYVYRSLCSVEGVAKAFGDAHLADQLKQFRKRFEQHSGRNYEP